MDKNNPRAARRKKRRIKENHRCQKPNDKYGKTGDDDFICDIVFARVNFIVRLVVALGNEVVNGNSEDIRYVL